MSADKEQRVEQVLERYGVWVKASPWEADKDTDFELMNIDDSGDGELPITEEEERLLGKLETTSHGDDFADISEIHAPKGGDSDSKPPDELHRIEEKLDALRDEIRHLKDEISELRLPPATQVEGSEKSGGYFDDEDDETIALTDDELVHILDSADMTNGIVDKEAEKTGEIQTAEEDTAQSDSAAELDNSDAVTMEPPEVEQVNLGGESIVNMDEIEDLSDEDEDFEEITDMEISGADTAKDEVIEDSTAEQGGENGDLQDSYEVTETAESEAFDEGEEVEMGLDEEEKDVVHEREVHDVEMEEISLDEFDAHMDETASAASDLTDKTRDAEELPDIESLETAKVDTAAASESEDDEIEQTAYSDAPSENEAIELSDVSVDDKLFDEPDIEISDEIEPVFGEEEESDLSDIEISPETLDEVDELDITSEEAVSEEGPLDEADELDIAGEETVSGEELKTLDELDIAGEEALDEEELKTQADELDIAGEEAVSGEGAEEGPLDEVDELDITSEEAVGEEELKTLDELDIAGEEAVSEEELKTLDEPDITGEEAVSGEGAEEGPLDEAEELDIIELDDEVPGVSDIAVDDGDLHPPEDAYKELPGTEEIDLDSLEALASNTKTEPEMLSASVSEEAALPGISSELRDEIKDVLKYMDQLLFSLPEEKVEEFRRSEHFEVYKKIFEDLGISK